MAQDEIGVYMTEIYCENQQCNVRHSRVLTKYYGDTPEPKRWRCPGCGEKAKVHWRKTLAEYQETELLLAIGRVNAALYGRDAGENLGVPANYLALETLPDSWKAVPVRVKPPAPSSLHEG